jgi:hypothetical protein
MNDMMDDIPSRVAVLEELARGTRALLERMDQRLDRMDQRLGRMDGRIGSLAAEHRADVRLRTSRTDSQFRWMLGIVLGGYAGLLGVMAHRLHWL